MPSLADVRGPHKNNFLNSHCHEKFCLCSMSQLYCFFHIYFHYNGLCDWHILIRIIFLCQVGCVHWRCERCSTPKTAPSRGKNCSWCRTSCTSIDRIWWMNWFGLARCAHSALPLDPNTEVCRDPNVDDRSHPHNRIPTVFKSKRYLQRCCIETE